MNIFLCLIFLYEIRAFEVLIVVPSAVKSEIAVVNQVVVALSKHGHKLTIVSAFSFPEGHSNVQQIYLPKIEALNDNETSLDRFKTSTRNLFKNIGHFTKTQSEVFWNDSRIFSLWKRRNEYDLFMTLSYCSEFTFPFLIDFKGSFIQICSPGVEAVSMSREGNWLFPSTFPSFLSNNDDEMTFLERLFNVPSSIMYYYYAHNNADVYTASLKNIFPDLEHHSRYYDRVALTLINGHFALDGPVPLLPSQIEIGTINIKKPKPLPKELEDFVNGSGEAGVIYFSLGSIAKSSGISQMAKEAFVEAFKRVPQRVLWKYEGMDLQMPPNVKVQEWLPQQDILGHPKTRVFISHCGNLGTQEAKYHGIPVLGVPIAFDQPRNAARMEKKGYAIVLKWDDLTADKIVSALDKLINDSRYKERLETISTILQDQKDTPADRAVWWVEYVVRHKGAPHLQYAGRRLSLFQYIMLDVLLFWATAFFILIFLVCYIVKLVCSGGKGNKTDSKDIKRKNQ